jgi:RNA polymerase sigma factor (TIGR02999 family)
MIFSALGEYSGMQQEDITTLLVRWQKGDDLAKNALFERVYQELKKISHLQLQQRDRRYLQTTELVHEAFLKMVRQENLGQHRGEFFRLAGIVMRRILIDMARKNQRDAELLDQPIDDAFMVKLGSRSVRLLQVDQVLTRLAQIEPRQAAVVEMRFFGGFNYDQIAEALEIGSATAKRCWKQAKGWIFMQLMKDVEEQDL